MGKSRILLLDEPTSQIDSKSQKQVLDSLFDETRKSNTSVLMIAHKLETAVRYSDRILVMDQGSVA
jgi:ABC-type multidrug transport system fused ATPase/permease subunit